MHLEQLPNGLVSRLARDITDMDLQGCGWKERENPPYAAPEPMLNEIQMPFTSNGGYSKKVTPDQRT
jgi:hypothetical protein